MRPTLLLCLFFLLMPSSTALAQEGQPEASIAAVTGDVVEEPIIEILVLEDGSEEVQEILPDSAYATASSDERYLAMKTDAQERIDILLEQIRELENNSEEGELQKQIEQIKMDAEIERLTVLKEDAEAREDVDLADEYTVEINNLTIIDQPIVGRP